MDGRDLVITPRHNNPYKCPLEKPHSNGNTPEKLPESHPTEKEHFEPTPNLPWTGIWWVQVPQFPAVVLCNVGILFSFPIQPCILLFFKIVQSESKVEAARKVVFLPLDSCSSILHFKLQQVMYRCTSQSIILLPFEAQNYFQFVCARNCPKTTKEQAKTISINTIK